MKKALKVRIFGSGRMARAMLTLFLATLSEAAAANLSARGNEPGWQIEVTDAGITFRTMECDNYRLAEA